MKALEDFVTQCTEQIFGHVPTREEKLEATFAKIDRVIEQTQEDAMMEEMRVDDAKRELRKATRQGDAHKTEQAARRQVQAERAQRRLQQESENATREMHSVRGLERAHTLLSAKVQMMQLVNGSMTQAEQQALMQQLHAFQYNAQRMKMVSSELKEGMRDAQLSLSDEDELSEGAEDRVAQLCRQAQAQKNQATFSALPKPAGSQLSPIVLSEPPVTMALNNREEMRKLDAYLTGAK